MNNYRFDSSLEESKIFQLSYEIRSLRSRADGRLRERLSNATHEELQKQNLGSAIYTRHEVNQSSRSCSFSSISDRRLLEHSASLEPGEARILRARGETSSCSLGSDYSDNWLTVPT